MAIARVQQTIITSIDELVDPIGAARMQPKVLRSGDVRAEFVRFDASGTLVEVADYSFPYMTEGESHEGRLSFLIPVRHSTAHVNGEAVSSGQLYGYGEASGGSGRDGGFHEGRARFRADRPTSSALPRRWASTSIYPTAASSGPFG